MRRAFLLIPDAAVPWSASLATIALACAGEWLMGRRWWCQCARASLWEPDIWSEHCSQHLLDPYVFTHIAHGLWFFGLLAWLPGPQRRLSFAWKFCIANFVEAVWEVLENTPWIIDRYRTETIAKGYIGDSIVNSLGDIAASGLGVVLARLLGFRISLVVFIALEVVLAATIRDNLSLNVLMLLWPIEAVKTWQSAGQAMP